MLKILQQLELLEISIKMKVFLEHKRVIDKNVKYLKHFKDKVKN